MAYNNFPYTDLNSLNLDWIIKKCKEAFSREIPTKTSQLENDSGFGTYTKPESGIPKSDLSASVQTSLNKADTAYQKPAGGIPETDLTAALQALIRSLAANEFKPYPVSFAAGSLAAFPDGADDIPVKDLTVSIEPVQSGTGEPSPDNVRPISGWTGANVTRANGNLFASTWESGAWDTNGLKVYASSIIRTANKIPVKPNVHYAIHRTVAAAYINVRCFNQTGEYIGTGIDWVNLIQGGTAGNPMQTNMYSCVISVKPGCGYIAINDFSNNVTTQYTMVVGDTPSADFVSPFSDTISIVFPAAAGTVYGGTLNVTAGKLTITHGQIASYAGETLHGEWLSDRDVYTPGTTPTTGAQVVYVLAAPIVYDLTPTEVTTLLGTNNIWADCGQVSVEYRADIALYIAALNT